MIYQGRFLTDFGDVRLSPSVEARIKPLFVPYIDDRCQAEANRFISALNNWLAPIYEKGGEVERITIRMSQCRKWMA